MDDKRQPILFALIQVRTRSSFTSFLRQPLLPALPATSTRELSHELSKKLRRKSTKARTSPRHGSLLYQTQSRTKRLYNALPLAATCRRMPPRPWQCPVRGTRLLRRGRKRDRTTAANLRLVVVLVQPSRAISESS